jgi:hypothetical protein
MLFLRSVGTRNIYLSQFSVVLCLKVFIKWRVLYLMCVCVCVYVCLTIDPK